MDKSSSPSDNNVGTPMDIPIEQEESTAEVSPGESSMPQRTAVESSIEMQEMTPAETLDSPPSPHHRADKQDTIYQTSPERPAHDDDDGCEIKEQATEATDTGNASRDSKSFSPPQALRQALHLQANDGEWATELTDSIQHNIAEPGRKALHNFFYPPRRQSPKIEGEAKYPSRWNAQIDEPPLTTLHSDDQPDKAPDTSSPLHQAPIPPTSSPPRTTLQSNLSTDTPNNRQRPPTEPSRIEEDPDVLEQDRQDREYVERFWTVYDDIIILSLFTQLGILCRLGMASWFRIFDGVFHNESALFTNLPLNCFACFVMGLLCSGESLMQIVATRFTPPRLQHDLQREATTNHQPTTSFSAGDDMEHEEFLLDDGTFRRIPISESGCTTPNGGRTRWRLRRSQRQRTRTPLRRQGMSPAARERTWHPKEDNVQEELREVQLLALERRIRLSPCLLLFPVRKGDVDVVENYFDDGYQRRRDSRDFQDLPPNRQCSASSRDISLDESSMYLKDTAFSLGNHNLALDEESYVSGDKSMDEEAAMVKDVASLEELPMEEEEFQDEIVIAASEPKTSTVINNPKKAMPLNGTRGPTTAASVDLEESGLVGQSYPRQRPHLRAQQYGQVDGGNVIDYGSQEHRDFDQIITNVATDVSHQISRIRRVRLADGWDVGTTPEEKSDDLMLGLRDGLCGALSSFSSWISSIVNLLRGGNIGKAFVGLLLGIQLPIVAYRFGQHVAVYIFVWRCRRETRTDIRRGYGIRLNTDDNDLGGGGGGGSNSVHSFDSGDDSGSRKRSKGRRTVQEEESETPSVRAIITALFIMAIVAQTTALNFYYEPEDRLVALSLLFSPLGVLSRWRLSKFNLWRPSFPIGTFACNIGACALSGSLGSLLAGNPGPRERIALVAIIAGFGGTLSSVARFIVETIAGMDPILFRMDGFYYAVSSVVCGLLVSFVFTASVDWADSVE